MADRRPLVVASGETREIADGDALLVDQLKTKGATRLGDGSGDQTTIVGTETRLGGEDSGTPSAVTIRVTYATGTNISGASLTIASGRGTGNAVASSLLFQTPTVTTSGSGTQTLSTRLTLNATAATFAVPVITLASASGAAGLNIPHGAAPSSPANGDLWSTTTQIGFRMNGVTRTFMLNGDGAASAVIDDFTSSGTWTKPAGAKFVEVIAWGGGGGGAGGNTTQGGGGGTGAGYSIGSFLANELGSTESVTVGSAGSGGSANNSGGNGGSTSFGSHLIVTGGKQGLVNASWGGHAIGCQFPGGDGGGTNSEKGYNGYSAFIPIPAPCPGGGMGGNATLGSTGGAGGAGCLRGPITLNGGGASGGTNANGSAGSARDGTVPGTGGGGGGQNASGTGYTGGTGGSGAGGGGGGQGSTAGGAGGAGGAGFCRVITCF